MPSVPRHPPEASSRAVWPCSETSLHLRPSVRAHVLAQRVALGARVSWFSHDSASEGVCRSPRTSGASCPGPLVSAHLSFLPLQAAVASLQRESKDRHSPAPCSREEKSLSVLLVFSSPSLFSVSLSVSRSYESSAEILPHTPRLTHFPTVSGSPASLADSMQQKLAGPRRRRPQNPSAM